MMDRSERAALQRAGIGVCLDFLQVYGFQVSYKVVLLGHIYVSLAGRAMAREIGKNYELED